MSKWNVNWLTGRFARTMVYLLLTIGCVVMLIPFIHMILTSLKTKAESMLVPIVWMPSEPQWQNYVKIFTEHNFLQYYGNTLFITVVITGFQLYTCAMAGYAFARLRFPGKNLLFGLCMTVLMVPLQMIMIPRYMMVAKMKLLNSLWGVIIPLLPSIYGTFLLRQSFMSIPRDMDEAATIDGCSPFGIFNRILLPHVSNTLIAFTLMVVLTSWNDLLWPLVILTSNSKYVLSIAIASFVSNISSDTPMQMTAAVYAVLPIVMLYLIGQNRLTEGIIASGIKA